MKTVSFIAELFGGLLIILLICLVVTARLRSSYRTNAKKALPETYFENNLTDTNRWLNLLQVWQCEDGSYQLRTDVTDHGHFATKEEAMEARYLRSLKMAELMKYTPENIPDCGKRIQ